MKRLFVFALLVAAFVGGCFFNHEPEPLPGLDIDVAIAGLSLADDCPSGEPGAGDPGLIGDCAPSEDGRYDGCGGFCQQSSVALAITADGDRSASFRIVRATLLDTDGSELTDLPTSNAQIYAADGTYGAWDETIPTPSELQVLYDLDGVDWSIVPESYGRMFRLRLVVEVDGVERTLTSEETTREYPVVT